VTDNSAGQVICGVVGAFEGIPGIPEGKRKSELGNLIAA
jgi:hypothetical protein